MKKIYFYEPWFFIFFGLFHMHRIWAIVDKKSYASFWINTLNERGVFYYTLMGLLSTLCILGIITFIKNLTNNYWWRWVYVLGGSYVLFDLLAIVTNLRAWNKLILLMFDTESAYWNVLWGMFVILGFLVFLLGLSLMKKRNKIKRQLDINF